MIGSTISHYKVIEKLGEGGMGEVYLAQDTKLDRKVALKFLQSHSIGDAESKERFIREARAASALNHRNISTIYEIDEYQGRDFICMEYVEGHTLKQLSMNNEQLSIDTVVEYTFQIAEALQAAHEKGIVHRDIKSENIMVTGKGEIKVMDFGLAKFKETSKVTKTGTTIGTISYMSPEQTRGDEVNHQSDIWSLGVVLYELLSGELPFKGDYDTAVMYSILNQKQKPLSDLRSDIPKSLEIVINNCLEKNINDRYQLTADLIADLHIFPKKMSGGRKKLNKVFKTRSINRKSVSPFLIPILVLALVIIIFFIFNYYSGRALPQMKPIPLVGLEGGAALMHVSPDGKQIAFVGPGPTIWDSNIFTYQIATDAILQLTDHPGRNWWPVWSADGDYIAYVRFYQGVFTINIMTSFGDKGRRLIRIVDPAYWGRPVSWFPDGKYLAFNESDTIGNKPSIYSISIDRLEKKKLTYPPDGYFDTDPTVSPDGEKIAFSRRLSAVNGNIFVLNLSNNEVQQLTYADNHIAGIAWTADSEDIVFCSNFDGGFNNLWRISASGGRPKPIQFGGSSDLIIPTISQHGKRLLYLQETETLNIWKLYLPASEGKELKRSRIIKSLQHNFEAEYSPDGSQIVFISSRTGKKEIWISDGEGKNARQLTFLNAETGAPSWSLPDGKWILFELNINNQYRLYKLRSQGGIPETFDDTKFNNRYPFSSRDGKWIYFLSNRSGTEQIWKMPFQGGEASQVTFNGASSGGGETLDRNWIYYSKEFLGVYKTSLEKNEERQVFKFPPFETDWVLAENGIYYTFVKDDTLNCIAYYDFKLDRVTTRYEISKKPVHSLALSPDQRWLLYSQEDQSEATVMLIENFE